MTIKKSLIRAAALLTAAALAAGCGILYTGVEEPYAYRSASPIDVKAQPSDPVAIGQSCNQSVLFLVSWGDGGYARAVDDALKGKTGVILYDVKADVKVKAYLLGLYTKNCTVVTGRIGRP
ncbi:MAG: TRL domain-containing protein [Elusimicrobiota bacterium]